MFQNNSEFLYGVLLGKREFIRVLTTKKAIFSLAFSILIAKRKKETVELSDGRI